jgi:hypothetical protein
MFCYQRKYNQQVQVIENSQQLMDILRDMSIATQVQNARACLQMGNEEAYQLAKRNLPLFLFSAAHVEKTKSKGGVEGYWRKQEATYLNGLAVLDIDHIEFPCALSQKICDTHPELFRHDCEKWKIFMIYVTPSDHGLKIVFAADPDEGNIADNQRKLSEYLGIENDEAIKDSSRGSFVVDESNVTYLNPTIVEYYNEEFDKKYGELYRKGNSAPINTKKQNKKSNETDSSHQGPDSHGDGGHHHDSAAAAGGSSDSNEHTGTPDDKGSDGNGDVPEKDGDLTYGSIPVRELALRYANRYGAPVKGDRHRSLIKVAGHFRYLVDNNASKLKVALRALPWVREWEQQESNAREIDDIADEVCSYKMWRELPKAIQSLLQGTDTSVSRGVNAVEGSASERAFRSDSEALADRLRPLLAEDPIYSACCSHLPDVNKVAGVFAAGGMFATLATRVHYLHYDGQQHRMNPQVFIIGKPASGKSFADWLDQSIMAVLRAADEPGRKAEADYKKENKKRKTVNKSSKNDKPMEEPDVVIRYIPSRTSNAVFYKRQINAKELVDGELMPLHLYTFDSELDSSVTAQSGGTWIGKHDLELKAFHNEFSGVDYANSDSVNEVIQVFWNQIVTGTDVSLAKKINMRNVNDGLCSRIAICRIESDEFSMIEKGNYDEKQKTAEELKKWGERFDALKGEVYVPKLVEHCYKLCEKAAKAAKLDEDHVLDYFRKRAVFYAEWFTIVRVLAKAMLQHDKDEKVDIMKPKITQSDLDFAEFIFDTVIYYQDLFFGSMLEETWANAKNAFVMRKQTRTSRNERLFDTLPDTFDRKQAASLLGLTVCAAGMQCNRWMKLGYIKKVGKGLWQKNS